MEMAGMTSNELLSDGNENENPRIARLDFVPARACVQVVDETMHVNPEHKFYTICRSYGS
jgi:hypothetical protein